MKIYCFSFLLLAIFQVELFSQNCSLLSFTISASPGGPPKKDTTMCKGRNLMLSANLPSLAQSTSYTANVIPFIDTLPCESIGSLVAGAGISLDDRFSSLIPIGFSFTFYNQAFNNVAICDNGFVTFTASRANTNLAPFTAVTLPPASASIPQNTIFGAMFDMLLDQTYAPPGGGSITTQTVGVAPYRAFIIKYTNVYYYHPTCRVTPAARCNMKIVLYETTNAIDIYIKSKPICLTINATQGLYGTNSTQFVATPGRNNALWNGANSGVRFLPSGTSFPTAIQWTQGATNLGTTALQPVNNFNLDSAWFVSKATITITNPSMVLVVKDSIKVRGLNNSSTSTMRGDTIRCADSIVVNGALANAVSYIWNNGSTIPTRTFFNNTSANLIRNRDSFGCAIDTLKVNVVKLSKPKIDSLTMIGCFNSKNNGSIRISASGDTFGIKYGTSMATLGSSRIISGIGYGSRIFYIQNSAGCSDSMFIFLDSTITNGSKRNSRCTDSSGMMRLSIISNPYMPYSWTLNNGVPQVVDSFHNIDSGVYTIRLSDKNGCILSYLDTVSAIRSIALSIVRDSVKCFGGNTGSILANLTLGQPPFTYSINSGAFGSSGFFSGLTATTYNIRARDQVGCLVDTTVSIFQYPDIVTSSIKTRACPFIVGGSITITALGGSPAYSYRMGTSAFQASNVFSNVIPGIYTMTVRDANLCIKSFQDTLGSHPKPEIGIVNYRPITCFGGTGALRLSWVTTSTPNYSYSWTGGGILDSIVNVPFGTYFLTVTDANNCKDTANITITQPSQIGANFTTYPTNCNITTNGAIKVFPNGGTPGYTYSLDGGSFQTSDSFSNVSLGPHVVTVRDAANCARPFNINITNIPNLNNLPIIDSVSCFGGSNGKITIIGSGGLAPYQYALGAGSFSVVNIISPLIAGSYLVRVKDNLGCIKDTTVSVFQYPNILVSSLITDSIKCKNGSDGKITATASGGQGPYVYSLNGGAFQSPNVFSNLGFGTYNVQVRDSKACLKNAPAIILVNPAGLTNTLTIMQNVTCFNQGNGKARVTVTGGKTPYTYFWSNGATIDSNVNLAVGGHYVKVTDNLGCSDSSAFTITQPTPLLLSANLYDPKCFNQRGSIKAIGSGGTQPYLFSINSGTFNSIDSFPLLLSGSYNIQVKDANQCNTFNNYVLNNPAQLTSFYLVDSVKCFGASTGQINIVASGGTGSLIYKKNNIVVGSSLLSNLTAGIYATQVSDSNGCKIDSNIVVSQYPLITRMKNTTNINCHGASTGSLTIIAAGGNPNYQYALNTGAFNASNSFSSLAAGIHTTRVRDANLCVVTWTDTLTQNDSISYNLLQTNNSCFGDSFGRIKVIPSGGVTPYQYSFQGGPFGGIDSIKDLKINSYNFTIRDNLNCTKSGITAISQPSRINFTTTLDSIKCNKTVLGKITVNAIGGTPGYTYSLNGQPFVVPSLFSGLNSGSYNVRVRDAALCIRDTNVTLYDVDSFYFGVTVDSITCFNANDGKANIAAFGGLLPYQYRLGIGAFTSSPFISGIAPGAQNITVRDASGCLLSRTINLPNPTPLSIAVNAISNNLCFGDKNGIINLSIGGGTGALNYTWSNGTASLSNTGLAAGNYRFTLTDSKGCQLTPNYNITQPPPITIGLTSTNVRCNNELNGRVVASVSGGTPSYGYIWSNGSMNNQISNLGIGKYILTVTDVNGCKNKDSVTLIQPNAMSHSKSVQNSNCLESKSGRISITNVVGGTPPYSYNWSSNVSNSAIASNLEPFKNYVVTISDLNGCTEVDSGYIDTSYVLRVRIVNTSPPCFNSLITISMNPLSGVPPFSFKAGSDSNASGTFNIVNNLYTMTVKDGAGCLYTETRDMRKTNPLKASVQTYIPTCEAMNQWKTKGFASGGQPPYSYSWPSATAVVGSGDSAIYTRTGVYSMIVTDNLGCTFPVSFSLEPLADMLTAFVKKKENLRCYQLPEGSIEIQAKGGTPPYRYLWNSGQNSAKISGLSANQIFSVTVTDINGCKFDLSEILTEPGPMTLSMRTSPESCYKKSDGRVIFDISGGTATNQKYIFSLDSITFSKERYFLNLSHGFKRIYVFDENKCALKDSFSIDTGARIEVLLDSVYNFELDQKGFIKPSIVVVKADLSQVQYRWSPSTGLSCVDCLEPEFNGYTDETKYTLLVNHTETCVDTGLTVIRVRNTKSEELFVPSGFAPTPLATHMENRVFKAYGNKVKSFRMLVFNRWGEKVFESNHIDQGWDGSYKGEKAPVGIYTYDIRYEILNGKKYIKTGEVELVY